MTNHEHPCYNDAQKAAGREMSKAELDEMFGRIDKEAGRYMRQGLSPQEALQKAGMKMADDERLAGIIKANAQKRNLIARAELQKRIVEGDEYASLEGLLAGREDGSRGAALSIAANAHGQEQQVLGPLMHDLKQAELLKPLLARDEQFDSDVGRELWRLDTPEEIHATGNKQAEKAARILADYQETVRLMQNKQGAWIGKTDHYVTRQSHDMWKIRGNGTEADYHAWRDHIAPLLDDRTFDAMDARQSREEFLHQTWLSLASGDHDNANGKDWLSGFKGPGNMAKRVSHNRVLLFKDADRWLSYNKAYGQGHVIDSVIKGLQKGARNAAVMSDLGTNPEAMFSSLIDEAKGATRARGDFKMHDKLDRLQKGAMMDIVTGKARLPANKTIEQVGAYAKTWNQFTKLGGVMISSLPDLAVNASVLRHNGVPLLESYWNSLKAICPSLGSQDAAERKEIAQLLGVGIQGHLGAVMNRFATDDAPLGRASDLINTFYRLNGLEYWTDSLSEGMGTMLSHNLGRDADQAFSALHPNLQRSLRRFGIEEPEWHVLRHATKETGGNAYLLPTEVAKLSDDAIAPLIKPGQSADDVRQSLTNKLYTYITDQTREGMTEPDVRTQATFRGISNRLDEVNPILGQAARLMLQFKSFPLTHIRRAYAREVQRFGTDWPGIVHMIAGTTLLGYVAMNTKALLAGKEPHDPSDVRTWMAALQQGGGAGIYGDFLFGQQSRMGNSFLETAAGPTISDMTKLAGVVTSTRDELTDSPDAPKARSYLANLVRVASGQIPGGNLPFINMALKYGVIYRLQDMINPGYTQRYEKLMQRNQGQEFWLSPSWSPYGEH
ncbi:hypothetical protein [Saccharibacter floricola]|uniref:Uncharacterized protein n=1 Tax=Saccharibacter floricola DSM 15669 TaxID=1123227 RepID=A0ABQ0P040_9PROT|nr:hypothetical protein [Saccharibacter floricola]GBQ07860.1 hypothetical protein AA15669_1566 [Saccharibacter floricola DSM 15669]